MSKTLAISFPTRHRAPTVEKNLRGIMPELRKFSIPVYISDDSVDDVTEKLIAELQKEYSAIYYSHNNPPLGHDRNCAKTLALAKEDYVWYLGDSAIITPGSLENLMGIIQTGPDFVFLNREIPKVRYGSTGPVSDFPDFIRHNLWHLTLTSATIYSHDAIVAGLDGLEFDASADFAQLGVILHAMQKGFRNCYWVKEQMMKANRAKTQSYWAKSTIRIFAHEWANMVRYYQDVLPPGCLEEVIRSHSKKTWVLGPFNMHSLKKAGAADKEVIEKYWGDLCQASMLPKWWLRHYLK